MVFGVQQLGDAVGVMYQELDKFSHGIVVYWRDAAVRGLRSRVLEAEFQWEAASTTHKYIPVALHDIEACLLLQNSHLGLRDAFVRACWFGKMTMTHAGTVLGMLDGPESGDPGYCIVRLPFRLLRRLQV